MAISHQFFGQPMRRKLVENFIVRSKLCDTRKHSKIDIWLIQCHFEAWRFFFSSVWSIWKFSQCFGHSWYLAVDMQLFVLSPLPVYLIYRFRRKCLYALSMTVWLCAGCTIATYISLNQTSSMWVEQLILFNYHHNSCQISVNWLFTDWDLERHSRKHIIQRIYDFHHGSLVWYLVHCCLKAANITLK